MTSQPSGRPASSAEQITAVPERTDCDFCGMDDLPVEWVWDRMPERSLSKAEMRALRRHFGDNVGAYCWKRACPYCAELGVLQDRVKPRSLRPKQLVPARGVAS